MSKFRVLRRHARGLSYLVAAAGVSAAVGQRVHAQQVGVSVVPTAQRIQWSDDLALEDDYLYGGRLGLRFGKWVELQPFYFQRNGLGLDSTRAMTMFGAQSRGRRVDLKHYGTTLQFNLSDAAIIPFARIGAGVLRLEPDSAARKDRITVSAGGGVRFGFAGVNAEVFAEQLGFRMNPRNLFGPDTSTAPSLTTLRNLVYGAAVTIPLSTMREDEGNDGGLSGASVPLEPFVGRLRYAGAHNLPDLEVAGVRTGIDFSPVFGIRGFYWRGVNDERNGPAPVAGYGGEAQFNLATGAGLSPYLIAGAGQIDYKDNFADSLGRSRDDKTAFILGGGASFRLTDRLRINGAIRDYIMTAENDLGDVASTGDLTHNRMITAGLTISLGGRSTPSRTEFERDRTAELRALRAERDSARAAARAAGLDRDDRNRDAHDPRRLREEMRSPGASPDSANRARIVRDSNVIITRGRVMSPDGQWITIPVPRQGEIILRYGLPPGGSPMGGRSDRAMTRRVDSVLVRRDSVVLPPTSQRSDSSLFVEMRELERRLTARIEAMQRPSVTPVAPAAPSVTMISPSSRDVVVQERSSLPVFERLSQTRAADLRPYLGLGVDDGDARFVLGTRADLGPINRNSGIHFVPELAVGFGGGDPSVLAFANLQYTFASVGGSSAFRPYATVGAGIYTPTVLGVNTAVGTSYLLQRASGAPLLLNLEVQGINLFNETRLLFGLSRGR